MPLQVWNSSHPLNVNFSVVDGRSVCAKRTEFSKYFTSIWKPGSIFVCGVSVSLSVPSRVYGPLSAAVREVAIGPPFTGSVL